MGETGSGIWRAFHPLLLLGLWLVAAFVIIGAGPAFFPPMASTVQVEAVIWKAIGTSFFVAASVWAFGSPRAMAERLGLSPDRRGLVGLVVGSLGGGLFVLTWFLVLRAIEPFHLESGSMSAGQFSRSVLVYLFGALLEELAFRGYPFLRLRERYGTWKAIAAVSLAFGLLHLPGMQGFGMIKIIALTGVCSTLFCIAFLATRSLWTAVGLHMGMNVALHSSLGGGGGPGPALFTVVFDGPEIGYDIGFWSFMLVALPLIAATVWMMSAGQERRPSSV